MGVSAAAPATAPEAARTDRFPLGFWLLTLAARGAGAGKEILLAAVLGTSPWKDALVAAWTAPALAASYGNETLPALLTPLWTPVETAWRSHEHGGPPLPVAEARPPSECLLAVRAARERPGQKGAEPPGEARRGASARNLVSALAAAQIALSVAALVWPRAVMMIVAPGLSGATLAEAAFLERWLALNIALLGGQTMLAARWNAERRFGWTPAGTSCAAAAVLAALAVTGGWDLDRRLLWIAAAITIGNGLGFLLMLLPLARRRQPALKRPAGAIQQNVAGHLWRSLGVLFAATLVLNLVPLAERMAASGLAPGSLSAFDYGERLVQMVFSLTVAPFTVVSFTRLAERSASAGFAPRFEAGWQGLLTLIAPAAVALAVFAPLLTRCLYGWGRFGAASLRLTAPVVAIKGAGLELDAAFYFLLFALYAQGRERCKLSIAVALAAANLPLLLWWGRRWGVAGLAAAHVAGCAAALAWIGGRRGRYLPGLRCRAGIRAGAHAAGLAALAALAVRALIPAAALAGRLNAMASLAWALLALTGTALLTALLAFTFAPGLWRGARRGLAPAMPPGASLGVHA